MQKVERKRCLWPDYKVWTGLQGSKGQDAVALEDLMLIRRNPLLGLINISLHQGNSTLGRGISSPVGLFYPPRTISNKTSYHKADAKDGLPCKAPVLCVLDGIPSFKNHCINGYNQS